MSKIDHLYATADNFTPLFHDPAWHTLFRQDLLPLQNNLLKELEETRKYEYPEAAGKKTAAAKTTNTLPVGQISPIGTHKNKIPVAKNMPAGNGR